MYKISDFATLSRVSAKMLRHYAALGLLTPAYVDPASGYRYYTAEQLPRLHRIVVLKDLGFPLEQIGTLLDSDLSLAQLHDALTRRRAEVVQRIADEQRRLAELDRRLAGLAASQLPTHEVVLRPICAAPVATAQAMVANDHELVALLADVERHVTSLRARAASPATVVYHGCHAAGMQIEVAVPLAAPIPNTTGILPTTLPGVAAMACLVHVGDDSGSLEACDALYQWVAVHGYRAAGPYRERYLRLSADDQRGLPPAFVAPHPEAAIIELQLPVIPVPAA